MAKVVIILQTSPAPSSITDTNSSNHADITTPTLAPPAASKLTDRSRQTFFGADACRAAAPAPLDTAQLYHDLAAAGLQYGPAFRLLRGAQRGSPGCGSSSVPTAAAAELVVPCGGLGRTHAGPLCGYLAGHPAMLDCMLQLGAVVPEPSDASIDAGHGQLPKPLARVPSSIKLFLAPSQVCPLALEDKNGGFR